MVKIPNRLEDLYPATAIEKILDVLQQPDLSGRVRDTLDRVGIRGENPLEQVQQAWKQARSWLESLAGGSIAGETYVINATGQLCGADFANLPITSPVAQIYAGSATKFQHAERLAQRVQRSSHSAFPHHSLAWLTSTYAALQQLLAGRQVLIARSDVVRIQGVGDISALLTGLEVVEVGPANDCGEQDWQQAFDRSDRERCCLLVVSPNGQRYDTSQAPRETAIGIAKSAGAPVIALHADAVFSERLHSQFGFPTLLTGLEAGADCVVAPLNLLIGGPQGAIAAGNEEWIDRLRQVATTNGTALSGPALAAANVALQLSCLENQPETGIERCLVANPKNLEDRARRIAIQLAGNGLIETAIHRSNQVALGPSPWSGYELENWVVELSSEVPAEKIRARLLSGVSEDGEVLIRPIASDCQDDKLILDLRFVDPEDDHVLVAALSNAPETPAEDIEA